MATDLRLKEGLRDITDEIVATYLECKHINHLGHCALPSREAVIEILADLNEILFPGFARRQNLHMGNVEYHVGDLVDGLHDKLTQQITRAMRHDCDPNAAPIDFEALAQQKTIQLLAKLPELRFVLEEDAEAAFMGDPAAKSHHEIVFCYPGLEAVSTYRIAHELLLLGVPLIPRVMTECAHSKTGIDIHPGAASGGLLHRSRHRRRHRRDVRSQNVKLYQGVTLGTGFRGRPATSRGMKRHPTLEDDASSRQCHDPRRRHRRQASRVVGSSVWLTHSVEPYTVVTLEKPSLRIKGPEARQATPMNFEI